MCSSTNLPLRSRVSFSTIGLLYCTIRKCSLAASVALVGKDVECRLVFKVRACTSCSEEAFLFYGIEGSSCTLPLWLLLLRTSCDWRPVYCKSLHGRRRDWLRTGFCLLRTFTCVVMNTATFNVLSSSCKLRWHQWACWYIEKIFLKRASMCASALMNSLYSSITRKSGVTKPP